MSTLSPPLPETQTPAMPTSLPSLRTRLISLDVFRGITMILLISHAFGLLEALAGNTQVPWLAQQLDHRSWAGCTLWDLIQPAFTFIVGVAMPFSFKRRLQEGGSRMAVFGHVVWRAVLLIVLSNLLSNWTANHPPQLQLINVLAQIAFGYVICFSIMQLPFFGQVAAALGLMIFHQGLFFAFPGPAGPFDPTQNIGAVLDLRLLGYNYSGNYTTLNCLGNAITILFGVWTGLLFLRTESHRKRLQTLGVCAASAFALGLLLSLWIPMVKRLWTASFTFFSAGWVLLALMAVYWMVEVQGWKRWTFPAIVVGTNCIFIYAFSQVLRGWLSRGIGNFTGHFWFWGKWGEVPQNLLVFGVMWYLCFWLYQRKIFFKI